MFNGENMNQITDIHKNIRKNDLETEFMENSISTVWK